MFIGELRGRVPLVVLARWQMLATFAMTALLSLATGGWRTLGSWQFEALLLSGVIGIAVASTSYFATIYAVGPRLTALLFSLASPFAVLLGFLLLGETVTPGTCGGIALVLCGVVLAVGAPRPAPAPNAPLPAPSMPIAADPAAAVATVRKPGIPFRLGVALGLLTAFGQALGSLLARPAMASGVEPFTAMAVRSGVAALLFLVSSALPGLPRGLAIRPRALGLAIASAFFGTTLGMSLLMAALQGGAVGIVSTFSSTTPVLILPMVWMRSGTVPPARAWIGALVAIAGVAVISLR